MPALNMTSVTWGGPDYATLFATSGETSVEPQLEPTSGTTFAIRGLGVKGVPPSEVVLSEDLLTKIDKAYK